MVGGGAAHWLDFISGSTVCRVIMSSLGQPNVFFFFLVGVGGWVYRMEVSCVVEREPNDFFFIPSGGWLCVV